MHDKAQGVREWAWHWVSVDAHQRSNVSNWEGGCYSGKQVQQPLNRTCKTIRGSGSCISCSSGRFPSAKKTKPKKSKGSENGLGTGSVLMPIKEAMSAIGRVDVTPVSRSNNPRIGPARPSEEAVVASAAAVVV